MAASDASDSHRIPRRLVPRRCHTGSDEPQNLARGADTRPPFTVESTHMMLDELADKIATEAPAGQVDMAGADYIAHPRRVAQRVTPNTPEHRAAALLHDVLEDTPVTDADLLTQGIPPHVVEAVRLLTRKSTVAPDDYYAAIRRNTIAYAVKMADIADNSDPRRLAQLDPKTRARLESKYATARAALSHQ